MVFVNPFRYLLEALWIIEVNGMSPTVSLIVLSGQEDRMGWSRTRKQEDLNSALFIALCLRILAWISLYVANRKNRI